MVDLLAVRVVDVNGTPVANAAPYVEDSQGGARPSTAIPGVYGAPPTTVFDLAGLTSLRVGMTAQDFVDYSFALSRDRNAGSLVVDVRSPQWGLFSTETLPLMPMLTLCARRVWAAPRASFTSPARDLSPPVVGDPGGIWKDGMTGLTMNLYTGEEKGFEFVSEPNLLGDPGANDWARFKSSTKDLDPNKADGGSGLFWLEYGDQASSGERMLLAVWVLNRAGSRPDGRAGVHVFFDPGTDIDYYAPADVFPYKIKRVLGQLVQPYSEHGHFYLSTQSGAGGMPSGRGFALAYQALATGKAHILVMPLNAYGYRGPVVSRAGLLRLIREVVAYVSDNTTNTLPARSEFAPGSVQRADRIAISGYSAGAVEAARLFTNATIRDLANTYGAMRKDASARAAAERLRRLRPELWESPDAALDRTWKEFYSIDGFFGSDAASAFPSEIASWFALDTERMLRVYATTGRMKDPNAVASTRLRSVFDGVLPQVVTRTSAPSITAQHWQRSDNRATLAWFSEPYMQFSGVNRMPNDDAHHTIPRVVISHALAQSGFPQM